MAKKQRSNNPITSSALRPLAEERLHQKKLAAQDSALANQHSHFSTGVSALSTSSSPEEILKIVHELNVHQIELEIQEEELARTRLELEESLEVYTELYDFAPTGYLTLGHDGSILKTNLTATKMLGVDRAGLPGMNLKAFVFPEDYRVIDELLETVFSKGVPGNCEVKLLEHPTFSRRTVRIDAAISEIAQECRVMLSDITEYKQTEIELHRLNRALMATNSCNQVLIHTTDEFELLDHICNIMVDIGGYRMAWVGYAEHDKEKTIRPVARAGYDDGYINSITITWADVTLGHGPTGTAIRTGEPCNICDIRTEPKFKPLLRQALEQGYASVQSLPLKTAGEVFGAITIYSDIPNAFSPKETELLTALVDNVSYGITMLRNKGAKEHAENELIASNARLSQALEAAHAGVWEWNLKTNENIWSEELWTLYGLKRSSEKPSFKLWADSILPDDREKTIEFVSKATANETEVNIKYRVFYPDSSVHWIMSRGKPFRDNKGEVVRYIGTVIDITEQKQTEKALVESEERFRVLFESHSAIMLLLDPKTGNIIDANRAASEFYRWPVKKLCTMRIHDINTLPPEEIGLVLEKWKSADKLNFLFTHRKADGSISDVEAFGCKIDLRGKAIIYLIIHDITERKHAAEESDRLKTAFLANISHEIRTPMNGIIGFSELLKDPHLTGEEQIEYIDLIHKSGERMLNLINDLMDISKIDAKEVKVVMTETSINKLLQDIMAFSKHEADRRGLRLSCTTGVSDEESIITTDSVKLNQILTNLIQNALKFTSKGGVDIGYTRKGNMLEFYVIDSGIGIAADKKAQIFERFNQADISLTRAYEGAGLGLSISKGFVELMGGTISVESIEGAGSTFTFTLPYNPEYPALTTQYSVLSTQHSEHCILIVEDDEVSTLLLKRNLKEENITLLCAENGWEAVELVQHHPEINLVLMDIKMPIMNGFDATKLIKQQRPDLPVIAQSAFTSKEDKEKAKAAGCDNFITKPINKNELLDMMNKLLKL